MKPQQHSEQTESPSFAAQNFPTEITPLLTLTLQWRFTWLHNLLPFWQALVTLSHNQLLSDDIIQEEQRWVLAR